MARGYPWQKWVTRDWLNDHCLGACSPATRGIWVDMLCVMDEADDFQLTGTATALGRLCRASEAEMADALDELMTTGTADVSGGIPGNFQVISRRRKREYDNRLRDRVRKRPDGFQEDSSGIPPTDKKDKKSSDKKEKKKTPQPPKGGLCAFDEFWAAAPSATRFKTAPRTAKTAFKRAITRASVSEIMAGLERAKSAWEKVRIALPGWNFEPKAATWLNGNCWNDDYEHLEESDGKTGTKQRGDVDGKSSSRHFRAAEDRDG